MDASIATLRSRYPSNFCSRMHPEAWSERSFVRPLMPMATTTRGRQQLCVCFGGDERSARVTTLGRSVGRRDRGERGARGNREPNSSDGDGRRARHVEVCRGAGGRRLPRSNTKSRSRVRYRAGRGLRQAEGGASSTPDRARANRISNASDAVRLTRRWGFKNVVFVSSRRASIDAGREKRKQRHGDGESEKKKDQKMASAE